YRTVGRLPLDDALAQLQRAATTKSGAGIDLSKAMKGWSEARIKAFKAIKTKPNTYYYRFNAPGEEQRTGQWTAEEQRLFHARLKEIGANGQWGIFSMTISGRVGYQCSNYYRYLVENRLINDPNYVLDEKGKAHFLFTTKKKNPDGTAMRVFRKHNKPHVRMSREKYGYSDSDEDEDEANQSTASSAKGTNFVTESTMAEAAVASSAESVDNDVGQKPVAALAAPVQGRKSVRVAGGARKRKRRGRFGDASSDDDVIRANEVELSDDGSGSDNDTSDGEYQGLSSSKRRCGGRSRNGNWIDHGVASEARRGNRKRNGNTDSGNSSAVEPLGRDGGASESTGVGSLVAATSAAATSAGVAGIGCEDLASESDVSEDDVDPSNPLPDLIDPITLEPVSKPAISPFGHVMGYNSWVRCLMFPPEGSQRNICPLTKKPMSKRDLVILTYDNIEQYRDKIVNL
ncbi:hypothetical protein GGF44_002642, partial [Coemansia sp. RSA 1694]